MPSNGNKSWFEAYTSAMLEFDPEKLSARIDAAREAAQARLDDIDGDSNHRAERRQIEDALSGLRTLERLK